MYCYHVFFSDEEDEFLDAHEGGGNVHVGADSGYDEDNRKLMQKLLGKILYVLCCISFRVNIQVLMVKKFKDLAGIAMYFSLNTAFMPAVHPSISNTWHFALFLKANHL